MLRKYSQFLVQGLFLFDLLLLCLCWVAAYAIRFYIPPLQQLPLVGGLFTYKELPHLERYLLLLVGIVVIWGLVFRFFGIYKPRRTKSLVSESADILKAFTLAFMVLVVINFFLMRDAFSRGCLAVFYVLGLALLNASHLSFRILLRRLRARGYNLRHVLIVGEGRTAIEVARTLIAHREMGYRIIGLLTEEKQQVGATLEGFPAIGTYAEVAGVVHERDPDEVIIALPAEKQNRFYDVLQSLGDELTNVHVVPDFMHVGSLRVSMDVFDGIPIMTMRTSPVFGWGGAGKRIFDAAVSLAFLLAFSWLLAIIALLVKLTSRGPVFYGQERMGLDGRTFRILKFRSMRQDAEAGGAAGWTTKDDPRRTLIGRLLRRTNLDELPQLFNVLTGDMSLVGPRPERPVFVEQFRKSIPKYMLRHKIKAGMTGWAQIHGWRGDTSIEERIKYDIYYIENWSLGFDVRILLMTLWRGFIRKKA